MQFIKNSHGSIGRGAGGDGAASSSSSGPGAPSSSSCPRMDPGPRVTDVLVSFDSVNNFGFTKGNVFFHANSLKAPASKVHIRVGTFISFQRVASVKKPGKFDAVLVEVVEKPVSAKTFQAKRPTYDELRHTSRILQFFAEKGFGFTADNDFVHLNNVKASSKDRLRIGAQVSFRRVKSTSKPNKFDAYDVEVTVESTSRAARSEVQVLLSDISMSANDSEKEFCKLVLDKRRRPLLMDASVLAGEDEGIQTKLLKILAHPFFFVYSNECAQTIADWEEGGQVLRTLIDKCELFGPGDSLKKLRMSTAVHIDGGRARDSFNTFNPVVSMCHLLEGYAALKRRVGVNYVAQRLSSEGRKELLEVSSVVWKKSARAHDIDLLMQDLSIWRADGAEGRGRDGSTPIMLRPRAEQRESTFHTKEVNPSPEDLRVTPVQIPVVVDREVASMEQHLDTLYYLNREDVMRPLRDGVQEYQHQAGNHNPRNQNSQGVREYRNVQLCGISSSKTHGMVYEVSFTKMPRVKWNATKRLMGGALVVLSSDQFQNNIMFGTVVGATKKEKDLRPDGRICLKMHPSETTPQLFLSDVTATYVMLESTIYWESYVHSLRGLQQLDVGRISPAIVDVLTCRDVRDQQPEDTLTLQEMEDKYPNVKSLVERLTLDASQRTALEHIFSSSVSVVQGPPGTGKSYVGVAAAQIKFHLSAAVQEANAERLRLAAPVGPFEEHDYDELRQRRNQPREEVGAPPIASPGPILVVCYTNHALDTYLSDLVRAEPDIFQAGNESRMVRVGAGCKLEELERFTLFKQSKGHARGMHEVHEKSAALDEDVVSFNNLNFEPTGDHWSVDQLRQRHEVLVSKAKDTSAEYHRLLTHAERESQLVLQHVAGWTPPYPLAKSVSDGWKFYENFCDLENILPFERIGLTVDHFYEVCSTLEKCITCADKLADATQRAQNWLTEWRDELGEFRNNNGAVNVLHTEIVNRIAHPQAPPSDDDDDEFDQMDQMGEGDRVHQLVGVRAVVMPNLGNTRYIDDLNMEQRFQLYHYLSSEHKLRVIPNIRRSGERLDGAIATFNASKQDVDLATLSKASIIGATTSGMARMMNMMSRIPFETVIMEEAAEISEVHAIAALPPSVKHVILIGDHQQLRPKVNVMELCRHNLDVSLMERLIRNKATFRTLTIQRRMRPEICDFIRPLYVDRMRESGVDSLQDHERVLNYADVPGVNGNIFFIKHDAKEASQDHEQRSASNPVEAAFVVQFASHLCYQDGVTPSNVTILVPYVGQVMAVRSIIQKESPCSGVRVVTVDDYQGEENDFIIISLTRSETIGFLKTENRITVALSRARRGSFVIGNFSVFRSGNGAAGTKWPNILDFAESKGYLRRTLPLKCVTHGTVQNATVEGDGESRISDLSPLGGCLQSCGKRRKDCGHTCSIKCHGKPCTTFKCEKPCVRVGESTNTKNRDCDHVCPKRCFEKCGDCEVIVPATMPCANKHECEIQCSNRNDASKCPAPMTATRFCKHSMSFTCGDALKFKTANEHQLSHKCVSVCGKQLSMCKHSCGRKCNECYIGLKEVHAPCTKACARPLECNHSCTEPCSNICPPCAVKCTRHCEHSKCDKVCGDICTPCAEPCSCACEHSKCTRSCSKPCDRRPCDEPCKKELSCGHPCLGLCGEKCPDVCRDPECNTIPDILLGNEDAEDARFYQLGCGHSFEVEDLDYYIDHEVKERDGNKAISYLKCPKCSSVIHFANRYKYQLLQIEEGVNKVKRLRLERAEDLKSKMAKAESNLNVLLASKGMPAVMMTILKEVSTEFEAHKKTKNHQFQNFLHLKIVEFKALFDLLFKRLSHPWASEWNDHLHTFASQTTSEHFGSARRTLLIAIIRTLYNSTQQQVPIAVSDSMPDDSINAHLERVLGSPLSAQERRDIVKALRDAGSIMAVGAFYTCPNGHPYAIGDCGGAATRGNCPECGAVIGGDQHRVVDGNRHFGEMDGSTAPAWPNQ